jgi:nitroreductase
MRVEELDHASIDHVLTTTRAVRQRLDLEREVPLKIVQECLEIALQAPTGFNQQNWRWLIVTDPEKRKALADIVRKIELPFLDAMEAEIAEDDDQTWRVSKSSRFLAENLEHVPVHIIPCTTLKVEHDRSLFKELGYETDLTNMAASGVYGELWSAGWSFMLALRSRGLGSSLTTIHLGAEPEAAELLGIPDDVSQGGLIPVAWFKGDDFKPANRLPLHEVAYYELWGQTKPRF